MYGCGVCWGRTCYPFCVMICLDTLTFDSQHLCSPTTANPVPIATDPLSFTFARTADGQGIAAQADGAYYIRLISADISAVELTTQNHKKALSHGSVFGPSTLGRRTISLKGEILAKDSVGQMQGQQTLRKIFRLDDTPGVQARSMRKVEFCLSDETQWFAYGQVEETLVKFASDPWQHNLTEWEATIQCEDPRMFGSELKSFAITEGIVGGLTPGGMICGLSHWDAVAGMTHHVYTSNTLAPMRITITGIAGDSAVPEVKHLSSGTYMRLATTLAAGETIVIDSFAGAIYKNGIERNDLLVAGSVFPQLLSGNNDLVLVDHGSPTSGGASITAVAEYRHVLV